MSEHTSRRTSRRMDTPLEPLEVGIVTSLPEHWQPHERYEQDSETRLWRAYATDNTDTSVRIVGARDLSTASLALDHAVWALVVGAEDPRTYQPMDESPEHQS